MNPIEINPQFKKALALLNEPTTSVFITGRAGTGKSTLLEYFCANSESKPVVVAPTGVAALNVSGQTIHSFFNFSIDVSVDKIIQKKVKPRNKKIYQSLKILIIDEISMVRADILDCMDVFLRIYGPNADLPFGGVKIVMVGDLYQLPPVVPQGEREIFSSFYQSPYFFSARVFENLALELIELEKIYRQKDEHFISLLNKVRNNSLEYKDIDSLNQRYLPDFVPKKDKFFIYLTTTNKRAEEINDEHLDAIDTKSYIYKAKISGDFGKEYFPTTESLHLKIGAQIMLLVNDAKKRYVNGSIGIIEGVRWIEDEECLLVRLEDCGRLISLEKYNWEVFRFKLEKDVIKSESVGSFCQYPIRLAWAVTIHKSQGKTFDKVILDLSGGIFAPGQLYVGLSRCRSLEGIVLKQKIAKNHIKTEPQIMKFMTASQYRQALKKYPQEEKIKIIKAAISKNSFIEMTYLKANDTKLVQALKPVKVGKENYRGKIFDALWAKINDQNQEQLFHMGRILDLRIVEENIYEG